MSSFDILAAAMMTPRRGGGMGLNVNVIGQPGTAKSGRIAALCQKKLGLYCETLMVNLMEAPEFQGYPFVQERKVKTPTGNGKVKVSTEREMDYAAPAWARRVSNAGRAVVFLDEMNTASPPVFAACMRMVNDGAVGPHDLGSKTRFIAAMNPTEIAAGAGGSDIPPALANRFGHITVDLPAHSEWADWIALQEGEVDDGDTPDAEALEQDVMDRWLPVYTKHANLICAYLASRPQNRLKMPDPTAVESHAAWPSLRTWEYAIRAQASAEIHGLSDEDRLRFVSAYVGQAATAEFSGWVREQDLPNPLDFLKGLISFKPDAKRPDRTFAFLIAASLAASQMDRGKRDDELAKLFEAYKTVAADAKDIVLRSAAYLKTITTTEITQLPQESKELYYNIGSLSDRARA